MLALAITVAISALVPVLMGLLTVAALRIAIIIIAILRNCKTAEYQGGCEHQRRS
jgi:hypothetical protein